MSNITLDATKQPLGRLATKTAILLRGKDQPTFSPNRVFNRQVVIEHIDQVGLTGKKLTQKRYSSHSGYLGHLKFRTIQQIGFKKAFQLAVERMLPKNRLRKRLMKMLIIK